MELRWQNFDAFLRDRAASGGERTAFSYFEGGAWQSVSFLGTELLAREVAGALRRAGHAAGDRVALLSPTSLASPPLLFGSFLAGTVTAPLDPKLEDGELAEILRHLEPRSLVVPREWLARGLELQRLAGVPKLLVAEELRPLAGLGGGAEPAATTLDLDQPLAIYYTSGTAGNAKGVLVSARNLLAEATMLTSFGENGPGDVIYSILPVHHLYGLVAGVLYSFACGAEYVIAHSLAPADIAFCLQERRVTQLNVVPLLLNLLRRGIERRLAEQAPGKRALVRTLFTLAPWLPLAWRRRLFRPIHAKLGGALRRSVSGAAPLDPATFRFFRAIGAPVYEGYGLTETGPVLTVNHTRRARAGSAGVPLPGVEIRIERAPGETSGEILTRGPHVSAGYFRAPELTQAAFADGWFRTGDLGHFAGGYLRITGRRKSLVVLPSGKKVHPEEVEQALGRSLHFQDVCVLGLARVETGETLTAVVHPTEEFLLAHEDAQAAAEREVALACRGLAAHKRPARVIVRREPFVKTSSGKVKRHVLQAELS